MGKLNIQKDAGKWSLKGIKRYADLRTKQKTTWT